MEKIRELWDEFRSGKPDGAIRQFLKYLVVGGGATLVEWALFWLLDAKLGLHHQWGDGDRVHRVHVRDWGFGRLLDVQKERARRGGRNRRSISGGGGRTASEHGHYVRAGGRTRLERDAVQGDCYGAGVRVEFPHPAAGDLPEGALSGERFLLKTTS